MTDSNSFVHVSLIFPDKHSLKCKLHYVCLMTFFYSKTPEFTENESKMADRTPPNVRLGNCYIWFRERLDDGQVVR